MPGSFSTHQGTTREGAFWVGHSLGSHVCFFVLQGKPASELRAMFNISNDFSPEEEAQVREENKWVERPSNP